MRSASASSTPGLLSCSVPSANRPLAAPLKNRNVGRDSSCGIALEQGAIARFEPVEVVDFLRGQLLEHVAAARVLHQRGGPGVELAAAAFGGNGDAQRVAREQQLGIAAVGLRRAAGLAGLARAVDLHHALARGEVARRRHFFDERFDVGAEELERAIAGLADQVIVARMPVRVLEAEAALAEIDLAGDAGGHHPLQRAVDGGAADAVVFALDEVDEIVGAQMAFLLAGRR